MSPQTMASPKLHARPPERESTRPLSEVKKLRRIADGWMRRSSSTTSISLCPSPEKPRRHIRYFKKWSVRPSWYAWTRRKRAPEQSVPLVSPSARPLFLPPPPPPPRPERLRSAAAREGSSSATACCTAPARPRRGSKEKVRRRVRRPSSAGVSKGYSYLLWVLVEIWVVAAGVTLYIFLK